MGNRETPGHNGYVLGLTIVVRRRYGPAGIDLKPAWE